MKAANLRATTASVDLRAIRDNVRFFRRLVGDRVSVMAVVKADGYGHGAVECARAAIRGGADWLGVAQAEEGVELREAGLGVPILILGPSNAEQTLIAMAHDLDVVVTSENGWTAILDAQKISGSRPRVHLKVDTGMGRVGVRPDTVVSEWIPRLTSGVVEFQGLMSHLAASDEPEVDTTRQQLQVFLDVIEAIRTSGVPLPPVLHLANSAAALRFPGTHFTLVRVGIGMYGALDIPEAGALHPAMEMWSEVSLVKRVPAGTAIGYGGTFITDRDSTIATIPVGYADGYRRAFSNRASVLLAGAYCPVVGRVSMDQITVLVPEGMSVKIGDRVVLLGPDTTATVSVHDWARWADTISYEVLTGISGRVRRVYRGSEME